MKDVKQPLHVRHFTESIGGTELRRGARRDMKKYTSIACDLTSVYIILIAIVVSMMFALATMVIPSPYQPNSCIAKKQGLQREAHIISLLREGGGVITHYYMFGDPYIVTVLPLDTPRPNFRAISIAKRFADKTRFRVHMIQRKEVLQTTGEVYRAIYVYKSTGGVTEDSYYIPLEFEPGNK